MPELHNPEPDFWAVHCFVLISMDRAYISCFFRLPLGVSNTVELGLPLNMGFAERDPFFSLSLHAYFLLMS